jgi:hypothetical protein
VSELKFVASTAFSDYLMATDGDVGYTIVGPRTPLPSPWPELAELEVYSHPELWTASRSPTDDLVAGRFYLTRHASLDDAQQACHDDHEVIVRVRLWFEFMRLNDPRQLMPGWEPT